MTAAAAVPLAPGAQGRRPALVLAVCSMSVFLTGLDSTIVTTGLPSIGRSLQWSADAYTVTLASLLLSSGAAADRYGRRPVLQAGLAVFVLGSWLCSLAPSLGCLIAFRAVQGAGASAMNPAALGIAGLVSASTGQAIPGSAGSARTFLIASLARGGNPGSMLQVCPTGFAVGGGGGRYAVRIPRTVNTVVPASGTAPVPQVTPRQLVDMLSTARVKNQYFDSYRKFPVAAHRADRTATTGRHERPT